MFLRSFMGWSSGKLRIYFSMSETVGGKGRGNGFAFYP